MSYRNRKRTPVPGVKRNPPRNPERFPENRGRSEYHGGRLVRNLRADAHLASHLADYHNPSD